MKDQFPKKAIHKSFGEITLLGVRIECSSNNNTMYFFKLNGEYVWGYDYEITIPSETIPPVPSIPIVGGGSVASDRTEQCESAKEFLSKTTASGVIERKGVGEYSMSFDIDKLASILTIYASQVCADKEREMGLLKNELAKAKEEIEKSHMDKIYSIHDLKSELSAANESLTVIVRKNAELEKEVKEAYDKGVSVGRRDI